MEKNKEGEMRIEIKAWINHHFWFNVKNLRDLINHIDAGWIWEKEDIEHDEPIKIIIETED